MEEFCFLALRTVRGIDRRQFAAAFGCSLESVYSTVVQQLAAQGLVETSEGYIRLTKRGRMRRDFRDGKKIFVRGSHGCHALRECFFGTGHAAFDGGADQ